MDKFHYLEVTHAALEKALLNLGFKVSLYETYRRYEHQGHGAILMLPSNIPMQQQVRPAHLASARHEVVAMGVADEETFVKLLMEPDRPVQVHANGNGRRASKRLAAVAAHSIEAGQTQSQ